MIDFETDSCPQQWCPLNKTEPHNEDCCNDCGYLFMERFYEKFFCKYSDSTKEIYNLFCG